MGAFFKLHGDRLRYQLGIRFRALDFNYVHKGFAAGEGFNFFAKGFNIGPFLANHHTRAGGVNVQAQESAGTFNAYIAYSGHFELVIYNFANLEIFHNKRRHILGGEPAGTPILNITQSYRTGVNLVSHILATSLFFVGNDDSQMAHALFIGHSAALRAGLHSS